jgi:hypothetical protein
VLISVVAIVTALVLAALSMTHIYWALGGRRGQSAVVPTMGDRPLISPSTGATLTVAALLALSAIIVVGAAAGWTPTAVFRVGCVGIAVVLLARSIGDRRYFGLLKRVRDTKFARRDTQVYTPLCLALAAMVTAVAVAPR